MDLCLSEVFEINWEKGYGTRCSSRSKTRMRLVAQGELPEDTDVQCRKDAITGGNVCVTHGGKNPKVRAKALQRTAERKFNAELEQLADAHFATPVDNPLAALQQLAGEVVMLKEVFSQRVARLKDPGYASKAGEQLKTDVAVYERALDRCGKVLTDIARLNIDERLVRIEERQAELMVAVFVEAVSRMGLGDRQVEARRIISGILERQQ